MKMSRFEIEFMYFTGKIGNSKYYQILEEKLETFSNDINVENEKVQKFQFNQS